MKDVKSFNEKFDFIENKQDPTEFNIIISNINRLIKKDDENFIELCYWFAQLKAHFVQAYANSCMYYGGYENKSGRYVYDNIISSFGLSENTVNRMINIAQRFADVVGDKVSIKKYLQGFNRTKLFEILPMSDEQIEYALKNKCIACTSSRDTIRTYVKSLKGTKGAEKVPDETTSIEDQLKDVEPVYNPKNHYDFAYFEKKTKSQLLNIVWELQKEYEKIKGGGKK